jgi:RNA-directed DNA polymerase
MRTISIPKKTPGKYRTIYIPDREEMSILRSIAGDLEKKARQFCPNDVIHGFTRQRSPVTNAQAHIGYQYTLCFDLSDFFDTVTPIQLTGKLSLQELNTVLVDGSPRQGLPTSPAVANIAAADMDHAILKWRNKHKHDVIYTRYADDMTFSYNDPALTTILKTVIPQVTSRCGFKINDSKTHFMDARRGRRIITGISVGEDNIYPTRRTKRRLRSALHQQKTNVVVGLSEWCKLKIPRERSEETTSPAEILAVLNAWNLPRLAVRKIPYKPTTWISEDTVISGDPIYMLGMSTWTNGWTSCMSQPNGSYRRGVIFWTFLPGTRVAALLSDRTKTVAGVERRVMRARALVHKLRNGVECYDRVYGNPGEIGTLQTTLKSAGIIPITDARNDYYGEKVVGYAPKRYTPYFDNLRGTIVTPKAGPWKGKAVRIARL